MAVLLFASSAVTVSVLKLTPAVALAGAVRVKCVAAPGVKFTCAVCVTVVAPTVAVYVTVCVAVAVTENVATPEPLVVAEAGLIDELPAPCARLTVWPESGWLKASLAVTVIVDDYEPFAVTDPGDEETDELLALTGPAVKLTAAVCVTVTVSVLSVAV